jgi:4,5-dihydroxyphthalate decarboxylase
MAKKRLTTVTRTQGDNEALKDGSTTPRRFELDFEEVPVLVHAFRRMVRGLEFDVCEMAFTTYLVSKAHGKPFTALPVFLVRGFHHGAILYNTKSGIRTPRDLEGRRVGVNRGYTVTTGVWARGILQDEYGVDLDTVTWVISGDEHLAEYRAPSNVVSMEPGATLEALLISGKLDAVIGIELEHPDVAALIPHPDEAAFDALRDHGLYPINHLIVVKDELLERYPDLASDVFGAFVRAKDRYVDRLRAGAILEPTPTDLMYSRVMAATGADPLPYGIAANRAMIEKLVNHAVRQGIIDHAPDVELLFAEPTRGLSG